MNGVGVVMLPLQEFPQIKQILANDKVQKTKQQLN